jgi:SAM-dependent methyltransferase
MQLSPPTTATERVVEVHIPGENGFAGDQDEEWCEVLLGDERHRIRFHDYARIYAIPGLYEQIFYDRLECDSPQTVCSRLERVLREHAVAPEELSVLELGAGNGMVGAELTERGVEKIVGVDILEEAAEAAARDRPGVYDDYKVIDLTMPSEGDQADLERADFNCLVTVAALGFGDIPPEAFAAAYDLIEPGGWIVFNIKEDFIQHGDDSGFGQMIRGAVDGGALELVDDHRYRHRLAVDGQPLHYVVLVARKQAPLTLAA